MNDIKVQKTQIGFIFSLVLICLFAWYIQHRLFLSWDVGALLVSTERLLQGGNYLDDFFIANTPMIMYLYTPAIVFSKLLHVNVTVMFPVYIFLLTAIAFFISYRLVMRIFLEKDIIQAYLFLSILAVIFLIVPLYEFGQRDHLLVVMTMPYLLATVCRLQAKPLKRYYAIAIGLFAGLGVAIKPQFLILPILIETYYVIQQKNWLAWVKPETLAIVTVQLLYIIFVFITRQDYITVMMPYLIRNYYNTALTSRYLFFFNSPILFVYASIIFYLFLNKMNDYSKLSAVLCVALVCFIMTYIMQGFIYFYHFVPALSLAILMLVQLYVNIIAKDNLTPHDYKMMAFPTLGMLVLLSFMINIRFGLLFIDPALFFILFSVVFISVFLIFKIKWNILLKLALIFCVILLSYLLSNLAPVSLLLLSLQVILIFCMSLLMFKAIFTEPRGVILQNTFIAVLGIVIFIVPAWVEVGSYGLGVRYKSWTLNKLIAFIHSLPPHQSIYTFSTDIHYTFPLANYTDVVVAQRFDALWMVRGFIKQIKSEGNRSVLNDIRNNTSKTYILNIIVDDFRRHKPDFVFIQMPYQGQNFKKYLNFPFLDYFLQNKAFREIWKNYHYFATVEQPGEFKLDVYKLEAT